MSQPGKELSDLTAALNRLSLAIEGQAERSNIRDWELVGQEGSTAPAPQLSLEEKQALVAFNDYESFAELLPVCPARLLGVCERLRGGEYSAEYRAKRAWEAGYWASLALRGKIRVPRNTLPIDLPKCVYIILKAPGLTAPTRVSRAGDLSRLVGRIDSNNDSIFHGFPSLAEAQTYSEAAGFTLPCQHMFN